MHPRIRVLLFPLLVAGLACGADEPLVPPADGKPILQLDAGGPMAAVTALAFGPDGKTLYGGGFDKVVRAWTWDEKTGAFAARTTYHVPIGPGMNGLINALAVSPDGRWLAVAGSGDVRGTAGFGDVGRVVPLSGRLSLAMQHDWGAIYLFDLHKDRDAVTPLRAHRAPVLRLKFLPEQEGKPPLLVSLGREGKEAMAVRLWDAAAGRLLAERTDLPDPGGNEPPGLEAWPTGPKDKDVGVAVALARDFDRKDAPPGRLHYWDAGADRLHSTELDPSWQFTGTAAFRPGKSPAEGVLFTGGLWLKKGDATNGGYLRGWPVAEGGPRKDSERTEFINKGAPRTLVLLPATDGGPPDLAAAVEEFPGRPPSYRLVLIARTAAGGFGVVKASVPLWDAAGPVAVTAASPDGARLAVSGGADHAVWIYSREDLLRGKEKPLQKIGGAGAHVTGVAFVRKAGAPGLLLRQERPGEKDAAEWVLDAAGHDLQEGRAGWNDDGPDLDGWKVAPGDGNVFVVEKNGAKVGTVHLAAGQPRTFRPLLPCYALLPPCRPLNKPLLAVAYVEQGVSYLELFDVTADRRLRRCSGHVNVVRALAFSKDGRLLASAAEDQTVAVWSLTDLDKVIGKGGAVPGLVVELKEGKVVLSDADDGALSAANKQALADQKVGAGDVVEGAVKGQALQAFQSPQDVYDAAWDVKPGGAITLRIAGKDVALTVDQGEDERKPLFTFFLRPEARDPLWLAWTPVGPYDTDDRVRAEAVIGWHSNTGKASAPVEFSPAAQYRKESYRPGLLKHLFAEANLSGALQKWNDDPAPKPGMGFRLEAPKTQFPPDAQGRVLVQGPPPGLTLRAELYDILEAKVRRVRWRFDNGDWRDFDGQSELAFTTDLDKADLDWHGHAHEFSLLVETVEAAPAQYTRRLPVYFALPRPEITSELAAVTEVAAADFAFKAAATGDVRTTLRLNDGAAKAAGAKINETLHLVEGDNFIEVRAENEGAAPEFADAETATRRWKVRYTPPKKVAPPTIYFESVSAAADKPQDGKTLVVHTRTVRVRGRITSAEPLVEASCDGQRLAALAAANADRLDLAIDELITLKNAGQEQTVKFTARHAKGDPATKALVLRYEPPAPHFELDPDAPGSAVAADAATAVLRGRVVKAEDDPSEVKVEVRLNGRPVEGVEVKEDRVAALLTLRPGDNEIEVVLSNPFDRRGATAHCYRRRPPLVKSLEPTEAADKPLTDLTAVVESPADRPLSGVRMASDAVADLAPNVTLTKQPPLADGAAVQTWKVVVAGVLLKDGKKNRLSLWARNEDGESASPAETVVVRKERPAPQPPEVVVLAPRLTEEVVETPRTSLAFRVRWRGAVGTVAVVVNDRSLGDAGLVTAAAPDADGAVTYRTDALPLQSGPNVLRVRAVNRGGLGESEAYTLVYRRHTTFIRLTGLSAGKRLAAPDNPLGQGDSLRFPRQDLAEVWVHGEVEWPDETDPVLAQDRPAHVRVWVNDFEQFEAPLEARPPGGRVRPFTAALRLNNTVNRVEIASSDVKADKVVFDVPCSRPARDQRLHLLVVAPDRHDAAAVSGQVLTAFQARHVDGDRFDTAAFRDGRLYGPVIKLAQREEVFDTVENMKGAISGGADELNDVIVVFFQGEQVVAGDEQYLLTGETKRLLPGLKPGDKLDAARLDRLKETALTCDKFRDLLADVRGAKLVLLDAQDPVGGQDTKDRLREVLDKARANFPRIGCLDYVLLGAAGAASDHLVGLLRKSLEAPSSLKDLTGKEDAWSQGPNQVFRCYVPDGLLSINLGQAEK